MPGDSFGLKFEVWFYVKILPRGYRYILIIYYIIIVCMLQFDTWDNVDDTWDNVDDAWDNVDTCGCKRILELQRMLNLQAHGQSCYRASAAHCVYSI